MAGWRLEEERARQDIPVANSVLHGDEGFSVQLAGEQLKPSGFGSSISSLSLSGQILSLLLAVFSFTIVLV